MANEQKGRGGETNPPTQYASAIVWQWSKVGLVRGGQPMENNNNFAHTQ